jgi:hypothetical protein
MYPRQGRRWCAATNAHRSGGPAGPLVLASDSTAEPPFADRGVRLEAGATRIRGIGRVYDTRWRPLAEAHRRLRQGQGGRERCEGRAADRWAAGGLISPRARVNRWRSWNMPPHRSIFTSGSLYEALLPRERLLHGAIVVLKTRNQDRGSPPGGNPTRRRCPGMRLNPWQQPQEARVQHVYAHTGDNGDGAVHGGRPPARPPPVRGQSLTRRPPPHRAEARGPAAGRTLDSLTAVSARRPDVVRPALGLGRAARRPPSRPGGRGLTGYSVL